jgi:penicillin-insensitive murein endopeptidase
VRIRWLLVLFAATCGVGYGLASESVGTPAQGRLVDGEQLPYRGPNFRAYSRLGHLLQRTYVHAKVKQTLLDAYAELEKTMPGRTFIYGETGWPRGGRFRPHRTHQNGLSVDFMVPILRKGAPASLACTVFNKWCYAIEFDSAGRAGQDEIDFDAMAAHLLALQTAAGRHGLKIQKVIFDAPLQMPLLRTRHGRSLRMPFLGYAWVRHDEHYHVDFLPLKEKS